MLSLKNRLTRKSEIQKIQKRGTFFIKGSVQLKALSNNLKQSRFCVVAGLGFSKKATRRNSIKRLIRAYLRQNINKINPGWDMVIVAKKAAPHKPIDNQLIVDLHKILQQNYFLKNN